MHRQQDFSQILRGIQYIEQVGKEFLKEKEHVNNALKNANSQKDIDAEERAVTLALFEAAVMLQNFSESKEVIKDFCDGINSEYLEGAKAYSFALKKALGCVDSERLICEDKQEIDNFINDPNPAGKMQLLDKDASGHSFTLEDLAKVEASFQQVVKNIELLEQQVDNELENLIGQLHDSTDDEAKINAFSSIAEFSAKEVVSLLSECVNFLVLAAKSASSRSTQRTHTLFAEEKEQVEHKQPLHQFFANQVQELAAMSCKMIHTPS